MREEIKDLIINNTDKSDYFADAYELYEHLDYDGSMHCLIDSEIDIYNYPLRKWAVENYEFIEEAIDNGFAVGVTDFHKLIQCGQYVQLEQLARKAIHDLFDECKGIFFNVEDK